MSEMDPFRLDGRVAVVTGASRGIGNAIARGLTRAGARVFGVARSPAPKGDNPGFAYRQGDVIDGDKFGRLLEAVFEETGRLDVLVNAAGITLPTQTGDDAAAVFRKTLECNLIAVYDCCRQAVPLMERGGYGSIVNVASIGAVLGFPGNPGYVASKGGVVSMTRALALDYGSRGIRVNNLIPGYIRTAMTEGSYGDPERRHAREARTILGRWGEAEELAAPAIFLASPASGYMTGTDLVVDGGWTAKGL